MYANPATTHTCDCCGDDNMPHTAGLDMCDRCADETTEAYRATAAERDEFDHERDVLAEVGR